MGYGHLICQADWPIYQAGITEEAADRLFLDDLKPFIRAINTRVTSRVEQHEFDALVILTFNIGTGNFASPSVLKLVNDPNAHTAYPDLEAAWKAWNKSQGKVSNGLIHRRAAEWDIYCRCSYHTW
ncbi:MAG: lysozyme [Pseudomonadota bacterium]